MTKSSRADGRWVVLKFGGTSVSSRERWQTIAQVVGERIAEGLRPLVVCSAVSGVSDALERGVAESVAGDAPSTLDTLTSRHEQLAQELGLPFPGPIETELAELARLFQGAALLGEMSPRLQARVLAHGELMSTRLGAAFLNAEGVDTAWIDARECLTTVPGKDAHRAFLSATCDSDLDPDLQERLGALEADVLLTQGFIAHTPEGETALLGRGGSDTSAAYLAAKIGAVRCEIWTDVPGLYSADPRGVPSARLLKRLDYPEAQEIATTGASVLHPRCIHPLATADIPIHIRCTPHPAMSGTVIHSHLSDSDARVKAISIKRGVMLVSMETLGMWQEVGFLARAFACFEDAGLSIDLVSTSETNVTVTLDPAANHLAPAVLDTLQDALGTMCRSQVLGPCATVSLVGRNIRRMLHELGGALGVFEEQRIHLVSQAANDLNLSFVVDADQADRLVRQLHGQLFAHSTESSLLGPTWEESFASEAGPAESPWWETRRADLLALASTESPLYVYDRASLVEAAGNLHGLANVERVFFAVKANPHPDILRCFAAQGLGFECVSPGELAHVQEVLPKLPPDRLLFTPNFAPREEYAQALAAEIPTTLDNLHPLEAWPEIFRDRPVLLRLDPGRGRGHHAHVRTAGRQSKFGIAPEQVERAAELVKAAGARVIGLLAHAGSGIRSHESWAETAAFLAGFSTSFPDLQVLDLGGGLGIPSKPGELPLDLEALDATLASVRGAHPGLSLWLEPGRYLVAQAGVLLATVTQTKTKGDVHYVGINAGMNTLLRPALYGAWHHIVNLSRLEAPLDQVAHVVGPICETGDTLGYQRRLATASEGDVLLIATVGAYGRSMSSHYNLRAPAMESFLP